MKLRLKHIFVCFLLASGLWGCSDEPYVVNEETDNAPCSIAIAVDGNSIVMSRTGVVDPDDGLRGKQHVTRVQLYIFESIGEEYVCVANEDVKWKHLAGAMTGLETRSQHYKTEYQNYKDEGKYLFLAVGFDDTFQVTGNDLVFGNANSVAAFGKPEELITVGKKLSECKLSLCKDSKITTLTHSEVFAGQECYTKYELQNGSALQRPIELFRRVAGIAGYFQNAPSGTKAVELRLYTGQNTQGYLLPNLPKGYEMPKLVPDEKYIDFITSTYTGSDYRNGTLLDEYQLTEGTSSFTLSSYLLPIEASKKMGQSTLEIVLIGNDGNAMIRKVLYINSIPASSRSGTGIIDIPDDNVEDSKALHYPIRANSFYRIGSKDNPIDLSGATSEIYIEINPIWDEFYGGSLGGNNSGIGIDKDWGEHDGGSIDNKDK